NPTALISQSHFDYRALYLGRIYERHVYMLVAEGGRPIVGSCFELARDSLGELQMSAIAAPSAMIVAKGVDESTIVGAEALLRKRIGELLRELNVSRLSFIDQVIDGGLSRLTQWALGEGATIESQFSQIIDLAQSESDLWRALTKSCQWGVNWGRKHLV